MRTQLAPPAIREVREAEKSGHLVTLGNGETVRVVELESARMPSWAFHASLIKQLDVTRERRERVVVQRTRASVLLYEQRSKAAREIYRAECKRQGLTR